MWSAALGSRLWHTLMCLGDHVTGQKEKERLKDIKEKRGEMEEGIRTYKKIKHKTIRMRYFRCLLTNCPSRL